MLVKIWTLRSDEHVTIYLNKFLLTFSVFLGNKGGKIICDFSIFGVSGFIAEATLFLSSAMSNLIFLCSLSSDSFDVIDSFN